MANPRMTRRRFMERTTAAAVGAAIYNPHSAEATGPPNFVVILADDVSAFDFGCYGSSEHNTPNIDRLARTGVQFRTCYATPMCTPSRAELLTGKYGFRTRIWHNSMRPFPSEPGNHLGDSHTLFSELLKRYGYATCWSGKWQLDGTYPTLVYDYGFDEYLIHHEWMHNLPEGASFDGLVETKQHLFPGRTSLYWHPCIVKNGEMVPTTVEDYGPDIYTNYLIDFIKRHRERPFLAYYPMGLAHTQADFLGDGKECNVPVPELDEEGRKTGRRSPVGLKYNVEYIDHLVGRIVDALEEQGLRENTVVIFTGDNASMRYAKAQPGESGCHVPLIYNAPGLVQPQGPVDAVTDFSDIYATIADFAGAQTPENETFDGVSVVPVLKGERPRVRDWAFSYLARDRWLRDERWYLNHKGRLFDCGDDRTGKHYRDVTDSDDPEADQAKAYFESVLQELPAPDPEADAMLLQRYHEQWEVRFQEMWSDYEKKHGAITN